MAKFVISKRSNGEFQFNLKAGNHEVILTSEGYASRAKADEGIAAVRSNSQSDGQFEKLESTNGQFYFNLLAANNLVIGTSEMYNSTSARDGGIAAVKAAAPNAIVE